MVKKRVSGPSIPVHIVYDGMEAFREGRGVRRMVDDYILGAAVTTVITQVLVPGFTFAIPLRTRFMLAYVWVGVMTASDSCTFEFGWTSAVDGGGVFTSLTPELHVYTPAALEGLLDHIVPVHIPVPIRYLNGARSITARVNPSDAACSISLGYAGWVEEDL